jgi:flagellar hook-basal body complex protein FliE
MDHNTTFAVKNYSDLIRSAPPERRAETATGGFVNSFADLIGQSEAQAMKAMQGSGDSHALVQSLAQTELAVEAVVTIRNKVVEAYQEILRMPV